MTATVRGVTYDMLFGFFGGAVGFAVLLSVLHIMSRADSLEGVDKGQIVWALLLGCSSGSVLGMKLAERITGGSEFGILVAVLMFVSSLPGVVAAVFLMDKVGSAAIVLVPLFTSMLAGLAKWVAAKPGVGG